MLFVIVWALSSQWPWIALHVGFGLVLVFGSVSFATRAWRARQRSVLIACAVGSLAAIGAAFNGASFLIYSHDFSSMIMAGGFAIAIGAYVLALFLARAKESEGPTQSHSEA